MAAADLTAARLRELLHYDPLTGVFTRLHDELVPNGGIRRRAGSVIGGETKDGYITIGIDGGRFLANVLAWLYMTGEWPSGDVDHRDTQPSNNRWKNLRDITHRANIENRRSANKNNQVQLLGVHRSAAKTPRWCSCIHVLGKKIHLGSFATPEAAHAAYVEAKRRLHEGCTI